MTLNLLIIHALTHVLLPRARDTTRPFFQLSYYNPASGMYKRGSDDFYFVAYWTVVFTGLRAACMDYVLFPLARFAGITKEKTQTRFAEQAWLLVYYTPYFVLGMVSLTETETKVFRRLIVTCSISCTNPNIG